MFVPVILGSDKTTVSVATGHTEYWPLYALIGNIHNSSVTILGLIFHFSGPMYFPKTFLANQPPYQSPATKSHGPKGYHVSSWTATSPFKPIGYSKPIVRPIGNSIVLSLLFSIFNHDITAAHSILSYDSLLHILFLALTSWKSHHSIVLSIRSRDLSLVYKSDHISRVGP